MLLGFQDRFVPFVRDHSKTHSIRAFGKRRLWKVGDIAHCYAESRGKKVFDKRGRQISGMKLIGAWPVVKVEDIVILEGRGLMPLSVAINGIELDGPETEALFQRDGFRLDSDIFATLGAARFWKDRLPFRGQLIHWNPEAKIMTGPRNQRESVLRARVPGGRETKTVEGIITY